MPAPVKVEEAWTQFWADPAQSRCAAGAPGIWDALRWHWASFAASLPAGARVLDLGCGAGAVGQLLLGTRPDLRVTGIDAAHVPRANQPNHDLRSGISMERMPFVGASFGAVVSQFGYEYSHTEATAREVARVMAPGAKVSFLVHHAGSAIVSDTRARLGAVVAFLAPCMRDAFCGGDAAGFGAQMTLLVQQYPADDLIEQLAKALPSRLAALREKRVATWVALEDALAPERCVSDSLDTCCVGQERIEAWVEPLRRQLAVKPVSILREANGAPIAWRIERAIT